MHAFCDVLIGLATVGAMCFYCVASATHFFILEGELISMIIFFSLNSVVFLGILLVLFIASILNSTIQLYPLLESYIAVLVIVLIIRAVASIFSYITSAKKSHTEIIQKNIIFEIISNVLYIIAFCLHIKDMAYLQSQHPVITIICALLSIWPLIFAIIGSFNFNDFFGSKEEDFATTILLGVTSLLIIIATIIPSNGSKVLFYFIASLISSVVYKFILDI